MNFSLYCFCCFPDIGRKTTDIHRKTVSTGGFSGIGAPDNNSAAADPWQLFQNEGFVVPLKGWEQFADCLRHIQNHKFETNANLEQKLASFYDQAVRDNFLDYSQSHVHMHRILYCCHVFFSRSEILSNHIYLYAPQCLLLSYFLYILMHRSIYCCYIFRIGNSFHFLFQAVCICDNLQKQVEDSIKNDQRDPLTIKGIKYKFNYCTGFHLARFIVNDFLDEE